MECISQSLNNMKRNEESGNFLCLHFYFKVLSNCQLNFCSFICTIKIIFPSAIFGYLWRCWYFFPYFFSWTGQVGQIVPFRLSTCGQFRLYSVLQFLRTCHFEAIIFRNATYPKRVNSVLENVCIEKAWIPPKYESCHNSISKSKS